MKLPTKNSEFFVFYSITTWKAKGLSDTSQWRQSGQNWRRYTNYATATGKEATRTIQRDIDFLFCTIH